MRHVLVVEDDPHNAVLFRKILEKRAGFRVSVCEDAAEILRMVRSGEVDFVIMDISLGNTTLDGRPVSGIDLCRLLKSDPRSAGVPVMLATAHAMRGDAERLLGDSGANDYVSKPILDHVEFANLVCKFFEDAA